MVELLQSSVGIASLTLNAIQGYSSVTPFGVITSEYIQPEEREDRGRKTEDGENPKNKHQTHSAPVIL